MILSTQIAKMKETRDEEVELKISSLNKHPISYTDIRMRETNSTAA